MPTLVAKGFQFECHVEVGFSECSQLCVCRVSSWGSLRRRRLGRRCQRRFYGSGGGDRSGWTRKDEIRSLRAPERVQAPKQHARPPSTHRGPSTRAPGDLCDHSGAYTASFREESDHRSVSSLRPTARASRCGAVRRRPASRHAELIERVRTSIPRLASANTSTRITVRALSVRSPEFSIEKTVLLNRTADHGHGLFQVHCRH